MNCHVRPPYIIAAFFSVLGLFGILKAEDSVGVSSSSVVRSQLQSIADEVVGQIKLDPKGRIIVLAEGEEPRTLVENAFVESLKKNNYSSVIGAVKASEQSLQAYLFGIDIKVKKLDGKLSERTIRTNLEARTVTAKDGIVQLIGTFTRESKDTAKVFTSVQIFQPQSSDESSMMQRLLTPLIIIGGAIMIVYLFFTVRS